MARTRSTAAHSKVIEAALELVASRGLESTSVDAIAEASGVSKATIYKHWSDKDALLLEVLAEANGLHHRPAFDSGDARADMIAVLAFRPTHKAELRERIMPHFMAYSARNPSFGHAWRKLVMDPPRNELRRLLKQAVTEHKLLPDLDVDLSLALLLGPVLYWYVFLRRETADPTPLATAVVDAFWQAFAFRRKGRQGQSSRSAGGGESYKAGSPASGE